MKKAALLGILLLPLIASAAVADDEEFLFRDITLTDPEWSLRFEIGGHWHFFDSSLDLEADYGLMTRVSFQLFERLWLFGEFRHTETEQDVSGSPPGLPTIDVDTFLVGISGTRPISDSTYLTIHVAVGRQDYDSESGIPVDEEDDIYVAGLSVRKDETEYFVIVGGQIEYVDTPFNQPGSVSERMFNYVVSVTFGFQF